MLGFFHLTVVIENGVFDYMQPSAECYRRQMLKSIEFANVGGVPFDFNRHTHVSWFQVGACVSVLYALSS